MFRKVELTEWSEIRDVVALILNTKCCINIACNLQITIICQNMKGVKRWNLRKSFLSIIYVYISIQDLIIIYEISMIAFL